MPISAILFYTRNLKKKEDGKKRENSVQIFAQSDPNKLNSKFTLKIWTSIRVIICWYFSLSKWLLLNSPQKFHNQNNIILRAPSPQDGVVPKDSDHRWGLPSEHQLERGAGPLWCENPPGTGFMERATAYPSLDTHTSPREVVTCQLWLDTDPWHLPPPHLTPSRGELPRGRYPSL